MADESTTEQGLEPDPQEAPVLATARVEHVAHVVRLISKRRAGPGWTVTATLWTLAAIIAVPVFIIALMAGDRIIPQAGLVALVSWLTARTINRLARDLDHLATANAVPELGKEAIGPLIEALDWPDRRVQEVARIRLSEILPGLSESECADVSREQWASLYDHLGIRDAQYHPQFVAAVLRALPTIGAAEAVPYVERLAVLPGLSRPLRRVRDAARICLPLLEQRVAAREAAAVAEVEKALKEARTAAEEERSPSSETALRLKRLEQEMGRPPQMRLPFLLASWLIIVPYCAYECLFLLQHGELLGASLIGLLGAIATQLHRLTLTERHRRIARELAEIDDPNAVGSLAEALSWPETTLRAGVIAALTRLLPQMRVSDGLRLSAFQRSCLYAMLTHASAQSHTDFLVALLKALEQIGDMGAVEPVRQLAHKTVYTSRQKRVKAAAAECLPYLLANAAKNQSSQLLLRPASQPTGDSEVLLRPAATVGAIATEELLRPSMPDGA